MRRRGPEASPREIEKDRPDVRVPEPCHPDRQHRAEPEQRHFQGGGSVVNFRLATTETWRDSRGERQERTEWHSIAVWHEGLQDLVTSYLHKGAKVLVEGQLRTRKWQDQQGNDRYTTEVHVTAYNGKILFLSPRRDGDSGALSESGHPRETAPAGAAGEGSDIPC